MTTFVKHSWKAALPVSEPGRWIRLLVGFWVGVYSLAIAQNYIAWVFSRSAFYLSESVLFNTIWLFFIPGCALVMMVCSRIEAKKRYALKILLKGGVSAFVLTTVHLILFSIFVAGITSFSFYHSFDFIWLIIETFSEDFYLLFFIYFSAIGTLMLLKSQTKRTAKSTATKLLIKHRGSLVSVDTNSIQWIEADSPYVAVHTRQQTYLYSSTLSGVLKKLDADSFDRIHRSVIVNLDCIESLTSRNNGDYDVELKSGKQLRLSRTYSPDVLKKIK